MDLAALEEIRQLKYRYLRCVDLKRWDEIVDVFTQDASAEYGTHAVRGQLNLHGRDTIISYLRDNLGPEITTVHRCGQPEITISGNTATGTWSFEDTVIAMTHRVWIRGAAFYQDRYQRGADGRWRISHTGYQRIYETLSSFDDTPSLRFLDTMWEPPEGRRPSGSEVSARDTAARAGPEQIG